MNIMLSVTYYDSDYVGKANIANWCLILTDIISIIQSNKNINYFSYCYHFQIQSITATAKVPESFRWIVEFKDIGKIFYIIKRNYGITNPTLLIPKW